jgi:site-specific recombinase XerC
MLPRLGIAVIAVLLGCGLRQSEVAALTMGHMQQRDGRWCIVDLLGKHGRVRTVPMPAGYKVAIEAWTSAAGVTDDHVFRPVNRRRQGAGRRAIQDGRVANVPAIRDGHLCRREDNSSKIGGWMYNQ